MPFQKLSIAKVQKTWELLRPASIFSGRFFHLLARALRKINIPKTIQPFSPWLILLLFRKIMLNGLRFKPFKNERLFFPDA